MAVSIVKRPEGYVTDITARTGVSIVNDGYGNALLQGDSALSHGDYVYVTDSFPQYNGFWYLYEYQTDKFYLREYPTATNVGYVQNASIPAENLTVYKSVLTSNWNCVHLPIQYKISNTLYPTNSVDTARSVTQIENNNGYIKITVNGSLGTFEAYDWVKVAGSSVDELNASFQILTKHSSSQVTINAAWELTEGNQYVLNSGTVQKFYNNYKTLVKVYAGLRSAHSMYALNPIELIDTRDLTPASDNITSVNINELVKEKINTFVNRPYGNGFPYNVEAFCNYYIEVAESYDQSDGTQVTTYTGSYTSDSTNYGWATDAFLEFRNKYAGNLANYIYADSNNMAKFLTLFSQPRLFPGYYFDIGIVNNFSQSALYLQEKNYSDASAATLVSTQLTAIPTPSSGGIIRIPIEQSASELAKKIAIIFGVDYVDAGTLWTNSGSSSFTLGATTLSTGAVLASTNFVAYQSITSVDLNNFESLSFGYSIQFGSLSGSVSMIVTIYDASGNLRTQSSGSIPSGAGDTSGTLVLSTSSTYATGGSFTNRIVFQLVINRVSGTLTDVTITLPVGEEIIGTVYSEEKTIQIDQNCASQQIYLTWKNMLGGYDHWLFTARKDYNIDIPENLTTAENIYPSWPSSYGEHAQQITRQTKRRSQNSKVVRSQHCTREELDAISYIKTSPLVQIVYSKFKTETVLVDASSFKKYTDQDDLFFIEFTITETDQIPSQS